MPPERLCVYELSIEQMDVLHRLAAQSPETG
jgi:hypothetical protein